MRCLGIKQRILLAMVLILVAFIVAGCAPYLKIGVYKDMSSDFCACRSENTSAEIGAEKRLSEEIVVGFHYEHISHISCGFPFNEHEDDPHINQVGITLKVGGI